MFEQKEACRREIIRVQKFPTRFAGSPYNKLTRAGCFRFMCLPQKRSQHMRCLQIEVVVRTVKIRWHRRNKVRPIFARKCLTKLDAGDLGDCVSFIGWLERTA